MENQNKISNITGIRIREMRLEKNWTQKDLANKLGLKNETAIANYESGYSLPKDDIKLKMCEIFDCSMDYLMGKVDFRNNINVDIPEILSKYKDFIKEKKFQEVNYEILNDDEKNLLFNMINDFGNKVNGKKSAKDYYMEQLKTKEHSKMILTIYLIYLKFISDTFSEIEERYSKDIKETTNLLIKPTNIAGKNFIKNNNKYYMCPVYGRIAAGQPNWAEECIEGRIPLDPDLMNIVNPEEHFFLRVNGESMNKIIKNGAFALIHKQDSVENGEIAVVLVNGYDATLKKFTKQDDLVILEPQSNDKSFQTQVYDKTTSIKILGKYIGKMEINK